MSFPGPPPMEDHRNRFEPEESPPEPGAMAGPDITIANVKLTYIHAIQAVHDQGSLALISLMEMEPSGWEINEIPSEALDRLTDGFAPGARPISKARHRWVRLLYVLSEFPDGKGPFSGSQSPDGSLWNSRCPGNGGI